MLIDSFKLNINNIHRIDIVVGGYHDQDVVRFPMKLVYIIDDGNIFERITNRGYIYCRNDNDKIRWNTIKMKLGDSLKKCYILFI